MEDQGIQDAAIFLMSLGEEEAAEVFKHLSPKEVQKLGETIAKTRAVSHDRVDQVMLRFASEASSQSLLVSDTDNYVRAVLKRALGDLDRIDLGLVERTRNRLHMVEAVLVANRVHAIAQRHVLDIELLRLGIVERRLEGHAEAPAPMRRAIFSAVFKAAEVMMSRLRA